MVVIPKVEAAFVLLAIVPAAPTTTTLSCGTVVPIPVSALGNMYDPTAAAFRLCGIFLGV